MIDSKTTLLSFLFLAYVIMALFVPVMEPDATVYAEVAKNLLSTPWYELHYQQTAFLDKPHLPFWLTAISFAIFGVNDIAYKLPALGMTLVAVYYTYRSAQQLFNDQVAYYSVIILLSSLHLLLNLNDVRAEPFILGFTAASFYFFLKWQQSEAVKWLAVSALWMAGALMTKGIFTLLPVAALFLYLGVRNNRKAFWRQFMFGSVWVIMAVIFTFPVMLAYYLQFDSHPEMTFNLFLLGEQTQVSGVKFFLWDSQFGRFFNNGPITIQQESSSLFFLHSTLWAFWPWALVWFVVLFFLFKEIKTINESFVILLWASLPLLLLFSLSQFQLPHYIVPLFPFWAILIAAAAPLIGWGQQKWHRVATQTYLWLIVITMGIAVILLNDFAWWVILITLGLLLATYWILYGQKLSKQSQPTAWLIQSAFIAILAMSLMAALFYPKLLSHQAAVPIAQHIKANQWQDNVACWQACPRSLPYRINRSIPVERKLTKLVQHEVLVVQQDQWRKLRRKILATAHSIDSASQFADYPVTRLSLEFLNPNTRGQTLDHYYLIKLESTQR